MKKTSPLLLGISGGADSLCLLGTLHEQGYSLIVAHFNHQLRSDSAEDAQFVAQIAAQYKLPFITESGDVAGYAKKHKESIEEAARNLRYKFLFTQARKYHAQAVAVGHTADDQVETVLMHFLRGAGLSGLKGMEFSIILPAFDPQIPLIRPILDFWRADTVAYCAEQNLTPREDPSNASDDYFRNRLRHNLIPELEKYNPRFRVTLQRTSHALRGDYALISDLTQKTWQEIIIKESQTYLSFQLAPFSKLLIPLIRNLIKFSVEKLRPGIVDISFSTLDRAAKFITSPQSAQRLDLVSGLILFKEQNTLYLTDEVSNLPLEIYPQMGADAIPITVSGEINLKVKLDRSRSRDWVLTVKRISSAPELKNADPFQVTLDAELLGENLILCPRRVGERFAPLGMSGKSMKLKDYMINVKLPKRARDAYPILYAGDEIAWVPGYQISDRFRVTSETKDVIVFKLERGDFRSL